MSDCPWGFLQHRAAKRCNTPSPPTKSLDFRGFDSSRLIILIGGNSMSVEFYRESPGKFDSRTLNSKTLSRWTGRKMRRDAPSEHSRDPISKVPHPIWASQPWPGGGFQGRLVQGGLLGIIIQSHPTLFRQYSKAVVGVLASVLAYSMRVSGPNTQQASGLSCSPGCTSRR